MQKTACLTTKKIVATITFLSMQNFFYAADNPHDVNTLRAEQGTELTVAFLQTQPSALRQLYEWTGDKSQLLVMSTEQLGAIQNPENELKQLFDATNIVTGAHFLYDRAPYEPWSDKEWNTAFTLLKWRTQERTVEEILKHEGGLFELTREQIFYKDVPTLLHDAKIILKALLPKQLMNRESYVEKPVRRLNRAFTYVTLSKIIEEEKLTHIHVPFKALIVKDKKTGASLNYHDASRVLDDIVHIYVNFYRHVDLSLDSYSDQYKIVMWAEKKKRQNVPFNLAASKELIQLIKKAPFDVGDDNIFADAHGDAVIIDTEFKGEPANSSIAKLGRYGITINDEQE